MFSQFNYLYTSAWKKKYREMCRTVSVDINRQWIQLSTPASIWCAGPSPTLGQCQAHRCIGVLKLGRMSACRRCGHNCHCTVPARRDGPPLCREREANLYVTCGLWAAPVLSQVLLILRLIPKWSRRFKMHFSTVLGYIFQHRACTVKKKWLYFCWN